MKRYAELIQITSIRRIEKKVNTITKLKEQAAGIAKEKSDELCKLIPGLKNELDMTRGKTKTSKDNIELIFKNGSKLDIMAARQSSRGKRATGGLMEECILID